MDGSSPLTRGKHQTDRVRIHSRGLIPAHAGKTAFSGPPRWGFSAHPRSRGENVRMVSPPQALMGSSPLTRGKRKNGVSAPGLDGLIPAHAGKTLHHPGCTKMRPAHPRSRGENHDLPVDELHFTGSSPLTRGKPAPYGPATMPASGSSPLTRGKRRGRPGGRSCVLAHPRSRGENGGGLWFPRGGGAHPRSRGENKAQQELHDAEFGSSPLTRGKLMLLQQVSRRWGLIPAHAGKTCLLSALA